MDIKRIYDCFIASSGVKTDTRKNLAGSLFFCLSGPQFNGNYFAEEALKKGAAFVIGDDQNKLPNNKKIILVEDSLTALQDLARYHREKHAIPVVAITGSNGKTTTKALFTHVLQQKFNVLATLGNLNNHIGVPLTLLNLNSSTEIALIEMGANHQKEIEALTKIALPTHGYITNFGKAHLEGFGGIEGVIRGKSELYDFLRATKGTALVNANDAIQLKQSKGINQWTFSDKEQAKTTLTSKINEKGFCQSQWNDMVFESHLTGAYNQDNINAAITLGMMFGLTGAQIQKGIASYVPKNNRSQWIQTKKNKVLLDAYNANPSSMKAALSAFGKFPHEKKGVILGDMLELGTYAKKEHQATIAQIEEMNLDFVLLVGPFFQSVSQNENHLSFSSTKEAKMWIENAAVSDAALLIKGSRGIALEQLLDAL